MEMSLFEVALTPDNVEVLEYELKAGQTVGGFVQAIVSSHCERLMLQQARRGMRAPTLSNPEDRIYIAELAKQYRAKVKHVPKGNTGK